MHIVEAFGGDPALLTWLPGGQGTSWRAGDVVLKPTTADQPAGWLAAVLDQVPDTNNYRIARPVGAGDGRWTVEGWAATCWLEGSHVPRRWEEAMDLSAALHSALADVNVEPLDPGNDPWSIGSRIAWGEQQVKPDLPREVTDLLKELAPVLNQPWTGPPPQVINHDLALNILYADGLPPAVIDMSPQVAPALFADAILVASFVAWADAPVRFASRFAATQELGAQLLARAVAFRMAIMAQLVQDAERIASAIAAYRPVVDVAMASAEPPPQMHGLPLR